MREWKLCEDGVFIIGRYLSPVPGPVSGTYWELQKHLSIKQSNRCLLLRLRPPRFQHREKMSSSKATSLSLLAKVGLAQKHKVTSHQAR